MCNTLSHTTHAILEGVLVAVILVKPWITFIVLKQNVRSGCYQDVKVSIEFNWKDWNCVNIESDKKNLLKVWWKASLKRDHRRKCTCTSLNKFSTLKYSHAFFFSTFWNIAEELRSLSWKIIYFGVGLYWEKGMLFFGHWSNYPSPLLLHFFEMRKRNPKCPGLL